MTLSVKREAGIKLDVDVALADSYNNLLAVMRVEDIYEWNREQEARLAYGTTDSRHPTVAEMNSWGDLNISGRLRVLALPLHYDFRPPLNRVFSHPPAERVTLTEEGPGSRDGHSCFQHAPLKRRRVWL